MAFYHRKFLLNKPADKRYASSCYMCYVCPKECYRKSLPPPPGPPPPPLSQTSQSKNNQSSLILILMLCVLSTVFLFLSCLTIAKYRSRRRNSQNTVRDENHVSVLHHPIWYIRTVGLPQSSIDSISILKYEKGKCSIESTDCSVCLSEFHENERLKRLPKCNHAFHVPCIDPWLRSHKNCPVCRAPVLIQGPNNASSSSTNSVLAEENQSDNEMGTRPQVQTGEASSENHLADNILSISEINLDRKDNKFRVFSSDLADRRLKLDQELVIWPVRRSVSMDFSSCSSMIFCAKKDEGCSDQDSDVIAKRGRKNSTFYTMLKSSSFGRSLEKRPVVSMKRSFSFSGKRQLRKSSGSLEAISIPGIQNRSR